jgi:hypothetical protein
MKGDCSQLLRQPLEKIIEVIGASIDRRPKDKKIIDYMPRELIERISRKELIC